MKRKGKITVTITIGIAVLALSTVMFMQFKLVNETDITSIENMREEELRTELANLKEQYDVANEQYEQQRQTLEQYQQQEKSDEETSKLVQEELDSVNLLLGKTNVAGEGIIITLRDRENEEGDFLIITSDILNRLVNELKLAGAEAISINDERIINTSDIATINETLILVNQQRIIGPYVIKAIGNKSYLESTLVAKEGYVNTLQRQGYDVSLETNDRIEILQYNKDITVKYMQEVKTK